MIAGFVLILWGVLSEMPELGMLALNAFIIPFYFTVSFKVKELETTTRAWQVARKVTMWFGVAFCIIAGEGISWSLAVVPALPLDLSIGILLWGIAIVVMGYSRVDVFAVKSTWRFVVISIVGGVAIFTLAFYIGGFPSSISLYVANITALGFSVISYVQWRKGRKLVSST
jgi:hypothetical protein